MVKHESVSPILFIEAIIKNIRINPEETIDNKAQQPMRSARMGPALIRISKEF